MIIKTINRLFVLLFILFNFSFASDKILASCFDTKTELVDIEKQTSTGYDKDSLKFDIVVKEEKFFISSNVGFTELIYMGGSNPQFLEKVLSGHHVLYTYYPKLKILTMQKSYDFSGPIMVNAYLKCK